jgi:toxin CcdB
MKRFDVYRNPEQRTRAHVPYFVVVQSDLIEDFDTRVVVPLMRQRAAATRLNPIIEFAGEPLILKTQQLASVPARLLTNHCGNLAEAHSTIFRAIDFLFSGF